MQRVQVSASSRRHPSSFSGPWRSHPLVGQKLQLCSSQSQPSTSIWPSQAGGGGGVCYLRTIVIVFLKSSKHTSNPGDVFIAVWCCYLSTLLEFLGWRSEMFPCCCLDLLPGSVLSGEKSAGLGHLKCRISVLH